MRVITGVAHGMKLKAPDGMQTRPTSDRVKEGMFNIIQFEIEGRSVLDLFAGSGQLGIEALSRGASDAVFIDARPEAIEIIKDNLQHTKMLPLAEVYRMDSFSWLQTCRRKFDLIFLDPPFAESSLEKALETILQIDILSASGIIVTERPSDKILDFDLSGLERSRDYRYGKTVVTVFRRVES